MRVAHHHTSATLIGFVVMMTLGCDGSNGPVTAPTTGAIHITVFTEGANLDLDTDGYGITVDGRSAWAIGIYGALTIDHLAPTSHFVNLNGLASNCSVATNQRWVDVVAGGLAQLAYNVECHPMPTDGDCGWDCYYWSQSARPSRYDIVSAKGRVFKPARVP
jgi:hypothetical protein